MSRWAVVNDDDPAIAYSDHWVPTTLQDSDAFQQTVTKLNNTVDPSQNTTHGSLSFTFNGTGVAIFGPFSSLNSTGTHATWNCAVDGVPIDSQSSYGSFPWQSYCRADGLIARSHVLTLNATSTNTQNHLPFLIDSIRYLPSASTPDGSYKWMLIQANDSQLNTHSNVWETIGSGVGVLLSSRAPNLVGSFTGTSISWYSLTKTSILRASNSSLQWDPRLNSTTADFSFNINATTGNYSTQKSVDSGIQKPPDTNSNFYNDLLFNLAVPTNATYMLTIDTISLSNQSLMDNIRYPMLTLDYLIVDLPIFSSNETTTSPSNSSVPGTSTGLTSATTISLNTASPTAISPPFDSPPPNKHISKTTATVLITLGSVAGAALIIFIISRVYRNRKRRQAQLEQLIPKSYPPNIKPFMSEVEEIKDTNASSSSTLSSSNTGGTTSQGHAPNTEAPSSTWGRGRSSQLTPSMTPAETRRSQFHVSPFTGARTPPVSGTQPTSRSMKPNRNTIITPTSQPAITAFERERRLTAPGMVAPVKHRSVPMMMNSALPQAQVTTSSNVVLSANQRDPYGVVKPTDIVLRYEGSDHQDTPQRITPQRATVAFPPYV